MKDQTMAVWVVVKVIRGFVFEARVCGTRVSAERVRKNWRRDLNPDFDEADYVECRLDSALKNRLLASLLATSRQRNKSKLPRRRLFSATTRRIL